MKQHPKRGTCPSCGERKRIEPQTGLIERHYAFQTKWGGRIDQFTRAKCATQNLLPKELQRAILVIARMK